MGKTENAIFNINTTNDFEVITLKTFRFQYQNNQTYKTFCDHLGKTANNVSAIYEIPFLPIQFFKSKDIITMPSKPKFTFTSSGTGGMSASKHHVLDIQLYKDSFSLGFQHFYGSTEDYCFLALLPSYLERKGSSLIYMVDEFIKQSRHHASGFFLYDHKKLKTTLEQLESENQKTILIGVSFALLDFVEAYQMNLKSTIVMETGGMKGRKKEIVREELHCLLKNGFGVNKIHSEYGMTELLSQGYSQGDGRFKCPPWMKVFTRSTEDPLSTQAFGKTGGLNIIDLANKYSCAFIATQDLGRVYRDGSFDVLGRFDNADIRGCNLMAL